MYIIANHRITDVANFWSTLGGATPPAGTKVVQLLPSQDGASAVCLWEADSVETIKNLVDTTVGRFSTNTFFAVDAAKALGLPG